MENKIKSYNPFVLMRNYYSFCIKEIQHETEKCLQDPNLGKREKETINNARQKQLRLVTLFQERNLKFFQNIDIDLFVFKMESVIANIFLSYEKKCEIIIKKTKLIKFEVFVLAGTEWAKDEKAGVNNIVIFARRRGFPIASTPLQFR